VFVKTDANIEKTKEFMRNEHAHHHSATNNRWDSNHKQAENEISRQNRRPISIVTTLLFVYYAIHTHTHTNGFVFVKGIAFKNDVWN
jgi:hypothetical protein